MTVVKSRNIYLLEKRRRVVVGAVYLLYILFLLEGPLRKWFLPSLSTPLIFIRDPIVMFVYLYSFRYNLIDYTTISRHWIVFALVSSLAGGLPFLINGISFFGLTLGIRSYWLYMPLAFVIASNFRHSDVVTFLKFNILTAIPSAILMTAQYSAGRGAFINIGVAGDDTAAVGIGDTIIRPFGFFTYAGINVMYIGASIAMYLALFLTPKKYSMKTALLGLGLLAVCSMSVLAGSRALYFIAAAIVGVTIVCSTIIKPRLSTMIVNLFVIGFVFFSVYLLAVQFPDMLEAMKYRFETAARSEGSIWNRVFTLVGGFIEPWKTAPFLGYGIGIGAPGVAIFLGLPSLGMGEGDLARNINELGLVLGPYLIVLRFYTSGWIVYKSMQHAKNNSLAALPLTGFVAVQISFGQITNSPLNAFLPWLVLGLTMALLNSKSRTSRKQF